MEPAIPVLTGLGHVIGLVVLNEARGARARRRTEKVAGDQPTDRQCRKQREQPRMARDRPNGDRPLRRNHSRIERQLGVHQP